MAELGIVDIREINKVIKSLYDYDFSNHALTSYKQRLERLMRNYVIGSSEGLIRKLEEKGFFDTFLYEVSVPSTEMFRDPSLWRWLREEYFNNILDKNVSKPKIWLPACVSGAELYSLAIMCREMDMLDKVHIIATSISQKCIDIINQGVYDMKKLEVSQENYKRFNGTQSELASYYRIEKDYLVRDTSLIANVEFRKVNMNYQDAPQNVKLILFRNNLIYHNPTRQEMVLQVLYRALSVSGHLVLGIREKIGGLSTTRDFDLVNETESVYRKKI